MIPWLLFTGAAALCLYVPFSHWAINAGSLGKHNTGLALFFSFTFPVAIYAALSLAVISIALVPFYRKSGMRGRHILLLSAFVGVLPLAYIWVLDLAGVNAG
jgi:hypothetical protein